MTPLRPYPAYKDSGVEWLGDVPEHWSSPKLKNLTVAKSGGTPSMVNHDYWLPEVPWVSSKDMKHYRLDSAQMSVSQIAVSDGKTGLASEDSVLIVVRSGILRHSTPVAIACRDLAFNQDIKALVPTTPRIQSRYLQAVISSNQDSLLTLWRKQGATVESIEVPWMMETRFPLPPLNEQRAIADFLDGMDARITRFIVARRKMIALLEEQKQAVVNQAVTRGLDPDVPLKDSGVDWLGEIPAHWEVRRLRSLANFITSGSRDWAKYYADSGAIFLRIGNLSTTSIDLKLANIQYVQPTDGAEGERTQVVPDDILLSITAQMGAVGLIPDGLGQAYINQHTALVRLFKLSAVPRFVAYSLLSDTGKQQSYMATNGGTKQGLGLGDVANLFVAFPPTKEQQKIVDQIDRETLRIDALIVRYGREIDLMREYRARLISDVVTGKLDVRRVELPLVEAVVGEEAIEEEGANPVYDDELIESL